MTTTKARPQPDKSTEKKVTGTKRQIAKPVLTKKAQLIRMLSRKHGTDVATISAKLGWLPHTTRAALSRLRKSGFEVTSDRPVNGKPSRYRITAEPATDAA
jgi:predicted ArsR family transcriptional regulator